MEKPVMIFGAKGIAIPALEIFNSNEVVVYGLLDEDKALHGTEINTISVLGSTDDEELLLLVGKECEAFVAIEDNKYRKTLVKQLNKNHNVQPVNAMHGTAYIATDAELGHGNFINAKVAIGAGTKLGNHGIFHSGCVIEHQVEIGDFVQVGAASAVGPHVKIEEGVFVGTGATIVAGITIGKNARIGAGSVVISNIAAGETVFGNPAASVKN